MSANKKLKQLLLQKEKIEEQLKDELDKRLIQIGKLAKKQNLLEWSDQALTNAFKFIENKGMESFKSEMLEDKKEEIVKI